MCCYRSHVASITTQAYSTQLMLIQLEDILFSRWNQNIPVMRNTISNRRSKRALVWTWTTAMNTNYHITQLVNLMKLMSSQLLIGPKRNTRPLDI